MIKKLPIKLNQTGFSLVEVLLVVIIAVLIIFTISNIPSSLKLVGASEQESLAREIAAKKLDDLRNMPYENLANGETSISDSRLGDLPGSSSSVSISDCSAQICTNNEEMKLVEIKVNWTESGKVKNVAVSSFISEGGIR